MIDAMKADEPIDPRILFPDYFANVFGVSAALCLFAMNVLYIWPSCLLKVALAWPEVVGLFFAGIAAVGGGVRGACYSHLGRWRWGLLLLAVIGLVAHIAAVVLIMQWLGFTRWK